MALLWIVLGLLLFTLAVTATPVKLWARFQSTPKMRFRLQVSPFGGLAPYLMLVDSNRSKRKDKSRSKRDKKPKVKKSIPSRGARRMIGNIPRLFGDFLSQIRLQKVTVNGRFGLGDPADTGTVFGVLCPIIFGASSTQHFDITVVPDYDQACFVGKVEASVSIIPLRLIPPIARFSWRSFSPWSMG